MIPALAASALLIPFLAALLGILAGRRLPGGAAGLAVAATAVSAALSIAVLVATVRTGSVREASMLLTPTGGVPIMLGVRVGPLAATVAVMVTVVALAVQVYSVGYLRAKPRYPSYAAMISLFTAAMLLVVLSADLLVSYVGWEIMGLCSYFLIGYRWERPADTAAAIKAFLMTRLGDVGFLFGIFVLGLAAGSFRVSAILAAAPGLSPGTLLAGTLLLTFGIVAKSAQFPLHSWLPDAMAGPAPVSALIHAATMVAAGSYVVALLYPVFVLAPLTLTVLAVLAAISMVGAALTAWAVEDLKRVLAYSTISQLGFVLAGLAVGGPTVGIAHLLAHAAFKSLLFLAAGAVLGAAGTTALAGLGGLRRAMPVTFWTASIGFAALIGLPPTSGFVSKDAIITAATRAVSGSAPVSPATATIVLVAALATVALTAAYATRAWLRTFFGPDTEAHEASPVLWGPLVALALPALFLGFAGLGFAVLRPDVVSTAASVTLAGIGILAAWLTWRRGPVSEPGRLRTILARAGYTDDLYERTVAVTLRRAALGVDRVDDRFVTAAVTGTGRGAGRLGGGLRLVQNGNAQAYATGLLVGVLVIALGVVVFG